MSIYELAHAYETVNLHRSGGAAKIELNRPESMNAWNRQFGLDLLGAVEACANDPEVRSVLLTGAGRGFSSGADLKDMQHQELSENGRPDVYKVLTERYHPIITGLRTMEKPVIAGVNGPAVGIGLSLALAADLVVASESAYFLLAFVNIGLVPDGGSSAFVPARIGLPRATELAMLGERLPAPKALEWGLINRVVPDAELAAEAEALAERLARRPDPLLRRHQTPVERLDAGGTRAAAGAGGPPSSATWQDPTTSSKGSWRSRRSARLPSREPERAAFDRFEPIREYTPPRFGSDTQNLTPPPARPLGRPCRRLRPWPPDPR